MAKLVLEIDPAEIGMDAARLARVDSHFARYVDVICSIRKLVFGAVCSTRKLVFGEAVAH